MNLQPFHVAEAFEIIRRDGFKPNKQSTKWDVIDPKTGERFPPKAVLRVARRLAGDESTSGSGGWEGTNRHLDELRYQIVLKDGLEESEEQTDIEQINARTDLTHTEKKRLVNARLGQGAFREKLIDQYGGRCVLTGCSVTETLRASHIKPWRDCDDKERLDVSNGLLLVATIDALFDRYLLTFDDDGTVKLSQEVHSEDVKRMGLDLGQKARFLRSCHAYLSLHRERFRGN